MGVENMSEVTDASKFYWPEYENFTKPALYAMLFCGRFIIFIFINSFCLYIIYRIFQCVIHQKTVHKTMYCRYPQTFTTLCPKASKKFVSQVNLSSSPNNYFIPMSTLPSFSTSQSGIPYSQSTTSTCPQQTQTNTAVSCQSPQNMTPRPDKGFLEYLLDCC